MFSSKSYFALALLALAALFVSTTTSAQNSAEESDSRIRHLLIEKRDVLTDYLTHAESQFAKGQLQSAVVLDAKLKLLDAELALANSPADRIKILRERLDIHRIKESQFVKQYKLGNVTFGENVDAIVERIDAEIALSRMSSW
jgi:hypothetical protein